MEGKNEKQMAKIEPIELTNIPLYNLEGNIVRYYSRIILDGEAAKKENKYLTRLPDQAIDFHKSKGKEVPSLALYAGIIIRMQEMQHPGLSGLLEDLGRNLATSTRINPVGGKVIHEYGFESYEINISLPNRWVSAPSEEKYWPAFKALLGVRDLNYALTQLEQASGKRIFLHTRRSPVAGNLRRMFPLESATMALDDSWLWLICGQFDHSQYCRSRGTVLEK